ncbi:hypothetical protein EMIHUDRAFT_216619 [Emiliania huxleyi CCMP1516]|uniref:McrBC 5-methylcytosine restriction system component n=2 Tax=Emiliania huxleyi TaxID=2903 RepID=A0A0D3IDB4_EMIH1|nr:hypothetical protein EMIHUDRAFT_216619 [Emiliania huxleyi CCMP1516]EOD09249.1 hypothetical protein EMIHUDRAFT_216619 [Emiliania huxleyi CCMP1516]|eukprot:XP_005761678.1 hypothetical protein EMIHUDRAFT_216619 [Emiliania huxleyi CCMP1516]
MAAASSVHIPLRASGGPARTAHLGPRCCVHVPPCDQPGCRGHCAEAAVKDVTPEKLEVCFRNADGFVWVSSTRVRPASARSRLHSTDVRGVDVAPIELTFKQKVLLERQQKNLLEQLKRLSQHKDDRRANWDTGTALIIEPYDHSRYDARKAALKTELAVANPSDEQLALASTDAHKVGFTFKTSRWVGRIAVAGAVVDIAPKPHVPLSSLALLELLLITLGGADLPVDANAISGLPRDDPVLLLACAYSLALETALRRTRGAICDYLSVRELCSFIRGRIDVRASLKQPQGLDYPPLVCSYDELTIDTPQNQLLKAAAHRVLELITVHAADRPESAGVLAPIEHRLRKAERMLGGVALRAFTTERELAAVELQAHNPRYRHYQQPLQLSKHILAASSTEACGGQVGVSLLVNMDTVFENFVRSVFSEVMPVKKGGDAVGGERNAVCPLSSEGADCGVDARKVRPDMVSCDTASRAIVGDAKHKRLHVSEQGKLVTKRDDVYQMLSYMSLFDAACGVFVYAACDPPEYAEPLPETSAGLPADATVEVSGRRYPAQPFLRRVVLSGSRRPLVYVCLDLRKSTKQARLQLRHAAEHCKRMAATQCSAHCDTHLSALSDVDFDAFIERGKAAGGCQWCTECSALRRSAHAEAAGGGA